MLLITLGDSLEQRVGQLSRVLRRADISEGSVAMLADDASRFARCLEELDGETLGDRARKAVSIRVQIGALERQTKECLARLASHSGVRQRGSYHYAVAVTRVCPCGYDLRAHIECDSLEKRCPECGRPMETFLSIEEFVEAILKTLQEVKQAL